MYHIANFKDCNRRNTNLVEGKYEVLDGQVNGLPNNYNLRLVVMQMLQLGTQLM